MQKKYAPTNHSVIFAMDFKSPKELAQYILMLAKDDAKYSEYLEWKTKGPDPEWIAMVDTSILHSECRFCIRSADIDRITVGEVVTGPYEKENEQEMRKYATSKALTLKIRERGSFWMRRIHLESLTVQELREKILQKYSDPSKGRLLSIYRLWDREKKPIYNDKEISELIPGHELEVIFENPSEEQRHGYTVWYKEHHKL